MPNVLGSAIQVDACVQGWMGTSGQMQGHSVLNANQLTSLNAMILYVAYKSGIAEFRVERQLSDRFNIPNAKCLPATSFDLALCYLVDNIKN